MKTERNSYIDFLKGIGIFLVILGHHKNIITDWIYSFHMPLFFMLAGIFHKNEIKYVDFLKKKSKSLLIPYFTFALILFLFWLIIGRKFGESAMNNTPIIESFTGIFYGIEIKRISSMEWGVPMWFLLCLFVISNIFYFISKLEIKKVIIIEIIFIFISGISKNYLPVLLPWNIQRALVDITFYSIGFYYKDFIKDTKNKKSLSIGLLCLGINFLIYFNRNSLNFLESYNINLVYLFGGFFGSIAIIELFKLVKNNKIIEYLGKNTIVFLAFHGRAMTFIKLIIIIILEKNLLEGNVLIDIGYSIIQVILCIPAIFIFNKYFPYLVGKKNK